MNITKLNSLIKVAMVATGIAACAAQARAVNVSYVDADGTTKQADATVVAASDKRVTWNAGWYVVTNEVTVTGGADCTNAVHLILADTGRLTISGVAKNKAGIAVPVYSNIQTNSLAIYGQRAGTGELTVTGGSDAAGIGGNYGKDNVGRFITINGGRVTATGGTSQSQGGAGIGGGSGGNGMNITINGGTVTATGARGGAGVGGGNGGRGQIIRINGGTVTATGGNDYAKGIGAGDSGGAQDIKALGYVIVKAGMEPNPTTEIAHDDTTDLWDNTNFRKRYVTTEKVPPPAEVTVTDVANAKSQVFTNEVEITERPAVIEYGTAFDVVYTADAGYMFPSGYKTFTTNLVADVAEITVTLTADQQPVVAVACTDCLTFSASEPFGIKMMKKGTPAEPNLEYSQDQIYWSKFDLGNGAAAGADNKLYLRGTGNTKFAKDYTNYYAFTNTADSAKTAIACSGNIMTLLDYAKVAKGEDIAMDGFAFCYLFKDFAALTASPELPATNLAANCYGSMFIGCTSLTAAPALPATKLAVCCYMSMFRYCTSLTAAPELSATNLASQCYISMFFGCTSLVVNTNGTGKAWSIPSDAATSAATAKYWNLDMFTRTFGSITNAPTSGSPTPGVTYYVVQRVKIPSAPAEVANTTYKVYVGDEEATDGLVWSNRTTNVASPADPVATVVYTADAGYAFADGETEKTVQLDTRVNPAVLAGDAPAAPGKATLKLGVVAQRYPWNGIADVGYKATFWPKTGAFGAVEVTCGETVTTNEFAITGFGTVTGTAPVDLSEIAPESKGQATFKAIVK